jgi:hypothetical protein
MYLLFVVRFMGAVGSYGRIYIYGMGLSPQADGQGRQQGGQDSADDSTTSNRKVATIHGTVTYDMSIDLICQYSDRSICKIGTQITKIWIYILDVISNVNIRIDPFATLVPKLPKSGYIFWMLYPMSIFGSTHLQHWYPNYQNPEYRSWETASQPFPTLSDSLWPSPPP